MFCELCGEPLEELEEVYQLVQDRFPTFDKEIPLETYHKKCYQNRVVQQKCDFCGNLYRITLIDVGEDFQNLSHKLNCPFCLKPFSCDLGFDRS